MSDPTESLAEKLDRELDEFIDNLPKSEYNDGWTPENWEKEMEKHPFFMSKVPEEGEELPPLVQAIQQLKYDANENSPRDLAQNYKDDGNFNFKYKKYRFAIAAYTEGLKQKCSDNELNAVLYANRAAAQFSLGNYRSALNDCRESVKLKRDHTKAITRAAQCCQKISYFDEGIQWCDYGLSLEPQNEKLLEIRQQLVKEKAVKERDRRKAEAAGKKAVAAQNKVLEAITSRGIQVRTKESKLDMSSLEPCHPAAVRKPVHLEGESLMWPVLFLYPQYGETDFVEEFHEDATFYDHLSVMFGPESEPAPWDRDRKYTLESLRIYFEDSEDDTLVNIPIKSTLKDALKHKRYYVTAGTPGFIVLSEGTEFRKEFMKRYKFYK